jgi:type VI secretion system protein ImpB
VSESTQKKLLRVRPPRVKITYDVETGGAIEKKELPLIVGIMADLAGKSEKVVPVKNRKFVEIDRDNFNGVMASLEPRLAFPVDDKLNGNGDKINVELRFKELDDFKPGKLVQQIKPLAQLFEARQKLNDLLAKLDGNDDLDAQLKAIVASTETQKQIQAAIGDGGKNG